MKIKIPVMVQDPKLSGRMNLTRLFDTNYVDEDFFLDGPVVRRVAVLDFDSETGKRRPGVPFRLPSGRRLGRYQISDEGDIYASDFMAVNVFSTVFRTMHMFEEPETLGRPLVWGFNGPQLLVVPRAGEWANAFYDRESRSLQFFFFENPQDPAHKVYTCLSRDIVSHETGHAILDGIAPRLYDAITPESLALHEAVADLVAVVMAFRSGELREAILKETNGSIANVNAFSSIAEEFGQVLYHRGYLRDLRNSLHMDQVDHSEPHELSQVLSAALYKMIIGMHERWWQKYSGKGAPLNFSKSGKALGSAVDQFKRMAFRALDYLPPAEVSFADYARAIIAADQASHPDSGQERQFIRQEFVERGIVSGPEALEIQTNFEHPAVQALDLETLVSSDWAAYDFANRNRDLLHIPADIPFQVEPRLDVTKLYYHREGKEQMVRECLFKVWWVQSEPNPLGPAWPQQRQISVGTTLAIDWETRRVRALLTTDRSARPAEAEAQRADRDAILRRLVQTDMLQAGAPTPGPDGKPITSGIQADVSKGVMRVRSMARMLHMIEEA